MVARRGSGVSLRKLQPAMWASVSSTRRPSGSQRSPATAFSAKTRAPIGMPFAMSRKAG
jgi:hypothetical protein